MKLTKNKIILFSIAIALLSVISILCLIYQEKKLEIIDLNNELTIVGIYQGETRVNTIPSKGSGWIFNKAECEDGATATWDNSTWSLKVNTSNKTRCKLYFIEFSQSATAYIESLSSVDTSLIADNTDDNNLRYTGIDPNNYILFNNELWRIIGVMNNVETSAGIKESLLKIRKSELLGIYSWDSSKNPNGNDGYGINQWGPSDGYEGADLMRELNADYLGNTYVGVDGKWYKGTNNTKDIMPTTTINSSDGEMIETVVWHLGSPNNVNGSVDPNQDDATIGVTPSNSYTRERLDTNGKICSSGVNCDDLVTRTSTWTGKVGLFYPSDYGFATGGGSTTDRDACLDFSMKTWNNNADCYNNNWLFDATYYQWTMSPSVLENPQSSRVFTVYSTGQTDHVRAYSLRGLRPVVFLKSSVSIITGSGTSSDPYILGYAG